MVQREVLNKVKADNLLVHVVWTPVLGNDNRDAAVAAEELFDDERVLQYWDGDLDQYEADIREPRQQNPDGARFCFT